MTVLYFGLYDPSYARNWVLINGLKKNGINVIELRRKPGRFAVIRLFFDYVRLRKRFDAMVVGFPGQEVMFLARILTRKPLIFDVFTSHYGGYILDRQKFTKNSWRAEYYKFLDKWSCKLADAVLLDTKAHIDFFVREYNLPPQIFKRIWAGANDDFFKPVASIPSQDKFHVLFFGTYIPLQGIEYIVRAAKILESESDIVFTLVGRGQEYEKIQKLSLELNLKNVEFRPMMEPERLRDEIVNCSISLGIFGNTPKTAIVIPNKVFMGVAMKKAVITADTPAIRELFGENDLWMVPRADGEALAQAILRLKRDVAIRENLAQGGYNKFAKFASHEALGRELKGIIENIIQ